MVQDRSTTSCADSTLVGRADDIGALDRLAREARWGKAGSVVVTGPAGVGKSALLHAFLDGDACRHAKELRGTCEETTAGDSLYALRALLGPAVRDASRDDTACRALLALTPGALAD
ncbi:hypothetical protein DF18_33465, partial [Streptomyces rimosus]|uniref:ATP-binding protein n=1 Tax=Streptomyces rimosus TaxID=1927 RepID=UPI0004D3D381